MSGECENVFCVVCLFGYYVEKMNLMGFCFFNNISVVVCYVFKVYGLECVVIIDFDVYYGNGIEDCFVGDEQVLMCSIFQYLFYLYCGVEKLVVNMCNVLLVVGCGGEEFCDVVFQVWMLCIREFKLQMIFILVGFDGYYEDDMGGFKFFEKDFGWCIEYLKNLVVELCQKCIVLMFEGGYVMILLVCSVGVYLWVLVDLQVLIFVRK